MKSFAKYFGVVAGMAALLVSCNKPENITMPEIDTVEMTIIAGSDETKTVLGADGAVTWSATGEQLAVIEQSYVGETATVAKATSKEGVTSDEGATMSFGVSLTAKTADSFNYYALYPSSAYVSSSNTNVENFKVSLASVQTPTVTSFGPEADILVSKAVIGETAQPTELKLQFARVIAVGKMTIKNLNTTENVKKVTFTATDKPVTGRSYINLTNAAGVQYGYADQGVDNVVLDYSGKEIPANGMTAYFTCWPFSIAAGESFSVVVETENYTFTREIVTIPEGKPLAFNAGRATGFNVSFTGIEGAEKTPATQLVPDGEYVIACEKNMMTVGTTSNKYRDVATLPEAANADGSYSVDASAAWNFVYDSETDTYLINSVEDNTLYLQGSSTGSDFKLVAKESATSFTITKNEDGAYKISNGEYSIGMNKGTTPYRFAMYKGSTQQPIDLNLYVANVLPSISVQSTLEVSNAETTASFPVTFANVSATDVNVYKDADCTTEETDWIFVSFNATETEIDYTVYENTGEDARTAYIKVYALGEDGESEVTAVVTVTQAGANSGTIVTVTKEISAISGTTTNGTKVSSMILDDNITLIASDGTNNGKVYSEGAEWRFYQTDDGTLTISAKEGCILVSATITFTVANSGILEYNSTTVSSATSVSLSGSSAVFSISDTSTSADKGQVKITAISVTYVGGSSEGGSEPVTLAAPTVSCSGQTENSLTFTWDEVANASGYQVSTDGGVNYGTTQTETAYTWTGLSAGTSYTLYVKAIGNGTSYTDSEAASATGRTTAASSGGEGGETKYFVKVTSTPTDWSGEYLIVYEDGAVAFDGSLTTLDAVSNTVSVTIENSKIEATTELLNRTFTININDGVATIKSNSGYYIGNDGDSNALSSSTTTSYTNTLSIDSSSDFTVKSSGGAYLRYNSASNQHRFRYYKSSSYTAQNAIQLYKLEN